MEKAYEKELDPFPEDRDPEESAVRPDYVDGSEENGVPALYPHMAVTGKTLALRAKWGV